MLNTKIMVLQMYSANVETNFASDVAWSLIGHVIVQLHKIGKLRTLMKVKISLGLWQTLNNVRIAENQLRKIKVAII